VALALPAALYVAGVWLEGTGTGLPGRLLPRPILYFLQTSSLFTGQAKAAIEYRAEVWLCQSRRWVELDTRPSFPINRDDKESRFHRTLHFFGQHRQTLQALEEYLISRHQHGQSGPGLIPELQVGGIRFVKLRRPIPDPGMPVNRWMRLPLSNHAPEQRVNLYWTPRSRRAERCGGIAPLPSEDN
jgi:hypothetical protein